MLNCSIVADVDPVTRTLRRGALLRILNPPQGVRYSLKKGNPNFRRHIGHYSGGLITMSMTVIRYLADGFRSPSSRADVEHTFFWSLGKHTLPWFHENDQSASQFLMTYAGLAGFPMRRVRDLLLAQTRSNLFRGFIVWSNWAKKGFVEDGFDSADIHVIPPPVPVRVTRDQRECKNILFIGRDYRRKGGDTALAVFRKVHSSIPESTLTYVGPLEAQKIPPGVKYYANPDDRTLFNEIYPSADIFFMPTRADAFGISLVEAMSFGIPPVTTNTGSIPEFVVNGSNGFIHDAEDVDSMAESILTLLQSPATRRAMSTNALNTVSEKFSPDVIGKKLLALYQSAV